MFNRKIIGNKAETYAEKYLIEQGMILIDRNFHSKMGEIDLIMQDPCSNAPSLVFVEVRYRKHDYFGGAAASVDIRKQHKLIRTAQYYLACRRQYAHMACRFDVISMQSEKLEWIKDAFQV